MSVVYVVNEHGGQWEDSYTITVKAFRDKNKADDFCERLETKARHEDEVVQFIAEAVVDFEQGFPRPIMADVPCYIDDEENPNYEFLRAVAEEAYRQAYAEWFDIWYGALEGKLEVIGEKPFVDAHNTEDPRQDSRNLGSYWRDGTRRYRITTIEMED